MAQLNMRLLRSPPPPPYFTQHNTFFITLCNPHRIKRKVSERGGEERGGEEERGRRRTRLELYSRNEKEDGISKNMETEYELLGEER